MLNAENTALLERALARAAVLVETDASLPKPRLEMFERVIDGPTSIEIVRNAFEAYADRPAVGSRAYEIVNTRGKRTARFLPAFETLSYRALWERIVLAASGLCRLGVRRGDIVSLVGFSTVDHVVAELACHYLAAVSVPFAKNVGARELELIVNECESTTVFCNVEQLKLVAETLRNCRSVSTLIVIDFIAEDDAHLATVSEARAQLRDCRLTTIAEIEELGKASRVEPVIPEEGSDPLLTLVYTSGSTGAPKGAMFCERSWYARWRTLPFLELASLPMVSVVFLPQNHMGGRNAVANSLKIGGVAYFTHASDMSTLFEDIRIVRPTYIHLVPRLSELIYQHYQSEVARRGDGDAIVAEMRESFLGDRMLLALTASAPTPPDVMAFVKRCFGIPVVDVFSGTEYGQLFIDRRLNHGNVLEHKLVDVPELGYLTTDQPHPRGELYVKTARGITSYFKNDAATAALVDCDGFMRTGDIFEQRGPDEMVWIDRKNNVQKLAQGEFVNIWKLEAAFASGSRFIKQVYIQGDSRRSYLLAVVVPELAELDAPDAAKATLRAEITRIAREQGLQPYETPRDFIVEPEPFSRDNGLLTSLNKPARPKLKQKYGPALERMYEAFDARQLASSADATLPAAERVRRTIAATLGLGELDVSQSFAEYGGDSIAAAKLCASIEREHGVRLSVGFVLAPGRALADVIGDIEARRHDASMFERIHGDNPERIFARDLRLSRFFEAPRSAHSERPTRDVLLTGATGFLGRFLCLELLERAARSGGHVYCIVRGTTDGEARRRLAEVFGPGGSLAARFEELAAEHLHVLAGDLERPNFGWPAQRFEELAERVDTVVHAAALVNHALAYAQLFDANVFGTAEVIRFTLAGKAKRFNYVSTNSVSLALLGDRALALETDDTRRLGDGWPIDPARHADGYRASKWAGEVLAQDLFETFGTPVNVLRCNLILPPAQFRRQIHADDFLTRLVRSVVYTGIYPSSFYDGGTPHLDGLPVDFLAAAVAAIATCDSRDYAVYHLNNVHWNDGVSLDSIMTRLIEFGYPLCCVGDHAEWFQRFERTLRALDPAAQAGSSLPIIDQWRAPLAMAKRARIDASNFRAKVRALQPHGVADIPRLDVDYVDRCIEDMRGLGLITSP